MDHKTDSVKSKQLCFVAVHDFAYLGAGRTTCVVVEFERCLRASQFGESARQDSES